MCITGKEGTVVRDLLADDKEVFLSMVNSFYSSTAVAHNVDPQNFEITFNAALDKSPFMRALIIEDDCNPVGYALLSFTHSNEAGGLVVLIEELYIGEVCRGKGLGSKAIEFIEQEYPSAKRFRLEVRKENKKAMDLYYRHGYKLLGYEQMVKDI